MTTLAPSTPTKQHNSKHIFWICFLFSVLILFRSLSNTFFYVFAGISLLVILLSASRNAFLYLLFLLPFASILKTNPDNISFFTILFFIALLKQVVSQRSLSGKLLLLLLLLFAYCLAFSGVAQLAAIATMVAGILMIYYIGREEVDVNTAILCFSAGICLASVLALFSSSFPIINTFIKEALMKLGDDNYATRFSGLQGNPNYYTLDATVAISAIIVLQNSGKTHKMQVPFLIILSIFGIMSISKSFLLVWLLLICCWFIVATQRGIGNLMKFVFLIILLAAVGYLFAYDSINNYLFRFSEDQGSTLDAVTTGRAHLWKAYWDAFIHNVRTLFLGSGLKTVLDIGKGAHNTYLELLFSMGVVGTILLLSAIKVSMGKIITKPIMWIPILALAFRLLAIGILTYDNLWFYLAIFRLLAMVVSDEPDQQLCEVKQ